jgi:dnaD domain protein
MLSIDSMQKAEAKFDAEAIRELFNREMFDKTIPKVRGKLKGQRLAFLTARVREYGIDAVREAITKAAQSDFLNGGGGRGFIASFEWIFRPNNFPKVLDGNFDNRQTTTSNGNQTDNQSAAQRVEAAANIVRRLFAEDDARASTDQGMPR